jgi:hypothetical protein
MELAQRFIATDELPNCDSEGAISTLKKTFNASQAAQHAGISFIEVERISEILYGESSSRRQCT